jgi:hypothetical protein
VFAKYSFSGTIFMASDYLFGSIKVSFNISFGAYKNHGNYFKTHSHKGTRDACIPIKKRKMKSKTNS